ncbi:MAG: chemotaxis protein CheW [Bryobacteraceae bacterium]
MEIADDGAGIDPERLKRKALEKGLLSAEQAAGMNARECFRLIFLAGFSTAAAVTNISGRGVGMDVVQRNIERIGGTVDIQSTVGEGTCFKIHIPLTLAIIPALAVYSAGQQFLIPQLNVARLVRLPQADGTKVEWLNETPVFRYRGRLLPLVCLDELLRLRSSRQISEPVNVVVLHSDQGTFGLAVDKVVAMREIVVKPFGRELGQLQAYAGATILGDGKVALILDVAGLTRLAGCMGEQHAEEAGSTRGGQTAQQTMLLFSCGGEKRVGVPLSLIERLERFDSSRIEWSSGAPVIQYRGRILPLASLEKVLDPSHEGSCFQLSNLPVIVINQEMRRIGLAVDQIIDIQTGELLARGTVTNPKLLCSAVFGGRVVDVLNLPEVLQAADPTWFRRRSQERQTGKRIVVAMPVRFHRNVVRHTLELAGHEAIEAATTDEAIQAIRQKEPHAVLCSLDLPEGGLGGLVLQLPAQIAGGLPLIGLSPEPDALATARENNLGAAVYVGSFDYKNILRAIDTLLGPKRTSAMPAQPQNEHSGGVQK